MERSSELELGGRKHEYSLFHIIDPLELDTASQSVRCYFEEDGSLVDAPHSTSVEDQQYLSAHRALMNASLHIEETRVVSVEDCYVSRRPNEQLLHIQKTEDNGGEMSIEELNRRADAYLSKFRKVLSLERQASLNRLNRFMSTGDNKVYW